MLENIFSVRNVNNSKQITILIKKFKLKKKEQ